METVNFVADNGRALVSHLATALGYVEAADPDKVKGYCLLVVGEDGLNEHGDFIFSVAGNLDEVSEVWHDAMQQAAKAEVTARAEHELRHEQHLQEAADRLEAVVPPAVLDRVLARRANRSTMSLLHEVVFGA